ncbi:fimbrillin family protein [Limibacterium fermenti]|uniref:fimbrillin family protein n=1 Tax=Limibacterium fermenti TaxID=3229863 RepID=UPI000E7EF38F|nr:hypothetical protein [Porphyromonadaceae bacterium]
MRSGSIYFLFLLFPFLLLSCGNDGEDTERKCISVTVKAGIEGMKVKSSKTRASGTNWVEGDLIGIYMSKNGELLTQNALATNVKYINVGEDAFIPADPENPVVYPLDGSKVDFIAYYPYKETIDNLIYPVDVSKQTDLAAIDLLYSGNAKMKDFTTPDVEINFSHRLCKIVLNFTTNDAGHSLEGISASITGVNTQVGFSLADGKFSVPSGKKNVAFNMASDGKTAEAILLPVEKLDGIGLELETGQDTYTAVLSEKLVKINSLDESTLYALNVILNPSGTVPMSVSLGTIHDWISAPSESFSMDKEKTIENEGDGTKEYPYSIEEARKHPGKRGVWVKGYIVGYMKSQKGVVAFGASGASDTNMAIATSPDETVSSNCMSVELPTSGSKRKELNLKNNPANLGKRIKIQGDITKYFGLTGIKGGGGFEFM